MSEYIICDLTEDEERILEEHDIEFLIDDPFNLNSRDINVTCTQNEFENILKLIGRTCSYPNEWIGGVV